MAPWAQTEWASSDPSTTRVVARKWRSSTRSRGRACLRPRNWHCNLDSSKLSSAQRCLMSTTLETLLDRIVSSLMISLDSIHQKHARICFYSLIKVLALVCLHHSRATPSTRQTLATWTSCSLKWTRQTRTTTTATTISMRIHLAKCHKASMYLSRKRMSSLDPCCPSRSTWTM